MQVEAMVRLRLATFRLSLDVVGMGEILSDDSEIQRFVAVGCRRTCCCPVTAPPVAFDALLHPRSTVKLLLVRAGLLRSEEWMGFRRGSEVKVMRGSSWTLRYILARRRELGIEAAGRRQSEFPAGSHATEALAVWDECNSDLASSRSRRSTGTLFARAASGTRYARCLSNSKKSSYLPVNVVNRWLPARSSHEPNTG